MLRLLFEHSDRKGCPKTSRGKLLKQFQIGDGNSKTSDKSETIPARIGNGDIMIKKDVIVSDLPLSQSKEAMKKDDNQR